MAYGLYLYKEIESKSGKTIRLEIFQKDYSGSSIEIESMSGVPLTLVLDNANSGVYLPIVKSFLNINIIDTEQIDYSVFFTPDATKFKVILKVNGTLEWSGYLTPDSFSQSLQYKSEINLVARDNLGMLSEFDFDLTNTFYSISTLINTALTRIGFQFTLETRTTKVDNVNETIVNGLTQSKFWVGKNWQEVLETILTGIGCQLRYVGGNKYAIFDIGNLSSLGTTEVAQPFIFIEQSGIQEIVPAWKIITINQDYGKGDNSYDGFIEEASFEFDSNKGGDENNPYNFYTRPYYTISLSNDWVSTIPMLSPYEYPNLDPNDIYITGKSPATTLFMGQDLTYGKYFEAINDGKAIQFKFKASNYPYYITRRRSGEYMVEPMLRARYLYEMKVRCNLFAQTATDKYVLQGRNWIIWTAGYSDALEFTLPQTKESGVYGKQGTELTSQMDSPQEQDITIEAYGLGVNASVYIEFYPYTATYTEVDGLGNVDDYPAIVYDVHTMKLSSFEVRIVENEFGGLETKATLNADHNINGGIELALGQVPRGLGGYNTYLGGIFKNSNPYYPPMYDFHFTGGINYTLSELVGREIAHHYKTQRKKLSGNIINSENFAAMPSFAKPFTDGTLTYALNYGSLDFRNEVMSVELIEVEDYETEDYTFVEATIDTGGTSLGSGETEFIQWSAAGNAKRIYELDTASDTDKAGAYIVVDKLGLSAAKKVALSSKIDSTQNVLLKEPTGFKSPESVIITYNSTNRTITLTGTIEGYSNGVLISELVSGWVSSPHPATLDNIYYLYYNGSSIVWSDSFPGFQSLFIAVVYYRTNNPFAQRECHGLMQWQSHLSSHNNIGTYRLSGGDISNIVIGSTTADNRRPIISECIILDEDLATTNAALTSKKYSIRYLSGANTINYTLQANDIVPLLGNNPYYNSFTTPNYGQTLMPDNSAMTIWLFEVPTTSDSASQEIRHAWVQGQSVTLAANSSAGALATAVSTESLKSPIELYLGENAVVALEYVCIHKFIVTYSGGNWQIASSIKMTGSRQSQVGSPSGSYLTAVSTDDTIDGNGSPAFPLSVSAYAAKKAGDILQDFSAKKLTSTTLLLPQSAPTLAVSEIGLYALESGFSGETPSGAGTLTSVALTMPTGFSVSGSPITESGTFGVTFASGYSLPTTSKQTNWDTAFGWGNHAGLYLGVALKGSANGLAELDATGRVPSTQLPSYVDDVIEVANYAALPVTGESGKIYITIDTNLTYRWTGTGYAEISQSLALGETSSTAYRGDRGKTAYDHSQITSGNPHGTTAAQVSAFYRNNLGGAIDANTIGDGLFSEYRWLNVPDDTIAALKAVIYSSDWISQEYTSIRAIPRKFIRSRHDGTTWGDWFEFWHSGNSGSTSFNWSAAKLTSTTLILPQTTPSLTSGEMAIYGLESGFSGETPSGAGSVTSISMVVPTGLSVTPATITESGTFTISYASGYQMMTSTESSKLAGIEANANNYSLPTATSSVLGGVKIGSNITITDGVISVAAPHNAVTLGTANGLSLSTQELSLGLASASANGALSSTDWSTFNNKQAKLTGTGASSLVRVNISGVIAYDDNTYLTGNQTIILSGIITGSGTTAITTAIADNALSIAKTNGLQSALDAKMATASYPDLAAIEALTGTSGFLKKTAANTWVLDTNSYALISGATTQDFQAKNLTLAGTIAGATTISATGLIITKSSGYPIAEFIENGASEYSVLYIKNSNSNAAIVYLGTGGNSVGNTGFAGKAVFGTANNAPIAFITNDSEKVGISGNGNMDVGYGGGQSEKLAVNGTTKFNGASTINGTLTIAGALSGVTTLSASGIVSLTNTTQSTAYTNGALVLSGGLGIAKDLYSNGKAVFASSVQMTENINTNLRIPKVAPTSPTSGEYYFYIVE